ncbi:1-aminocyclopropane-1-carboxylate oxidase homolog isoform X3 [Durio zibethinus]|uniref:1-aminocyclopropane-1-carboxylate oxidase homolog isoform X3 n=2 Tax=Durio zibethinus TaxID=66656 RepID=A0A6P5YHL9_DURZI|nr:1-aminocyclopropane-1-carboxylate oxidase homolog isoform X3 [Durio zibethinus]
MIPLMSSYKIKRNNLFLLNLYINFFHDIHIRIFSILGNYLNTSQIFFPFFFFNPKKQSNQELHPAPEKMASETSVDYDRTKELKEFDDTKAGVKGLVDAGIVSIPRMFIRPAEELAVEELNSCQTNIKVPIIDLSKIQDDSRRKEIVDEVRIASAEWGFFQVINHGIPLSVLDEMIDGVRMFNEQDLELKKEFYTREVTKKVRFNSNYDLYTSLTADWRDTLNLSFLDSDPDPEEMPAVCRKSTLEYTKYIRRLGETLFQLLSEALGLQEDYLGSIGCAKGCSIVCHYYPVCPQPELTLGVRKHADAGILTLLLQNEISGLQVLHEGQWFDVQPTRGGLVVNIGDLLQDMLVYLTSRSAQSKS